MNRLGADGRCGSPPQQNDVPVPVQMERDAIPRCLLDISNRKLQLINCLLELTDLMLKSSLWNEIF